MYSGNSPRKLGSVLKDLIERAGYGEKFDEVRILDTWKKIAGPQIDSVTDDVWVERGCLFVKLTSSAWRQELHMQRSGWLRRLNEEVEPVRVREIVFR